MRYPIQLDIEEWLSEQDRLPVACGGSWWTQEDYTREFYASLDGEEPDGFYADLEMPEELGAELLADMLDGLPIA